MADESRDDWEAAMSEAFTFSMASVEVERELEEQKALTRRAESELRRMQKSKWWRITSPLRKTIGKKLEQTPKRAEAKAIEAKSEVEARQEALLRRITTVLDEFAAPSPDGSSLDASLEALGTLLDANNRDRPLAWLTYIAMVSQYPTSEDMVRFSTDVIVNGAPAALAQLLKKNAELPRTWALRAGLELIRDGVVDASSTSHRDFHTGIQRVVRGAAPNWVDKHGARLIIWGTKGGAYRDPTRAERWRILEYEARRRDVPGLGEANSPENIAVPWETTVILPETAGQPGRAVALACLGEWSGNDLTVIFHDFLVLSLPETFPAKTRATTTNSNTVLRTARRVSTVSATVARQVVENAAFSADLGYPAPEVRPHLLPVHAADVPADVVEECRQRLQGVPGLPLVVSVSSIEPRKNHLMTLRAAEAMWKEGHQFQLAFVGWASWESDNFMEEFERSQSQGRPVRIIRQASEEMLWSAYKCATFTVFISVAEGYGLPAAESLAMGTPVLLSDRGSMAEVGASGGVHFVDPTDIGSVIAGMRTLLTDKERLEQLTEETQKLPQSSWDEYADATWEWLVEGKG